MVHKAPRTKKQQQVVDTIEPPPGLAPPPGLPVLSGSARKKAAKRLADSDLAGCPPGLSLPPGLEPIAEDAATSESTAAGDDSSTASPAYGSEEMHQVQLTGLPNEILSDMMFQAVLQQAQLGGAYANFSTTRGKRFGKALINFTSEFAAEWCVQHFHGRSWAADGTVVNACLLSSSRSEKEANGEPLPDSIWLEAWFQEACAMENLGEFEDFHLAASAPAFQAFGSDTDRPSVGFSFDTPAFVPTGISASGLCGGLSAEAPAFVPGQKSMALDRKFANGSDVSTVDGESESDEEKVAAVEVAA